MSRGQMGILQPKEWELYGVARAIVANPTRVRIAPSGRSMMQVARTRRRLHGGGFEGRVEEYWCDRKLKIMEARGHVVKSDGRWWLTPDGEAGFDGFREKLPVDVRMKEEE